MLHIEISHCTNDDVVVAAVEHRMKIAVDVRKHSVNQRCAVARVLPTDFGELVV